MLLKNRLSFIVILIFLYSKITLSNKINCSYAFFVFDNGEKNTIASMLNYLEQNAQFQINTIDFIIVFMGASIDTITQPPFSKYPDRLVHYTQLGITESIDHTWPRNQQLPSHDIQAILQNLIITQKVILPVSCAIFEQLLEFYQAQPRLNVLVLRDNVNPSGITDYFDVADRIQSIANTVAVPSQEAACVKSLENKHVMVVGHGPTDDLVKFDKLVDKQNLVKRLGLDKEKPSILYAGAYGENYETNFNSFITIALPLKFMNFIVAPHPRYKGVLEREASNRSSLGWPIIGQWEEFPYNVSTVEALTIADVVITPDASSTIVVQAKALKKKVGYINTVNSLSDLSPCLSFFLKPVTNTGELVELIESSPELPEKDIYEILGMPHDGARLLWKEIIGDR